MRRTILFPLVALASVVVLASIVLGDVVPIYAVIVGGLAAGLGLAALLGAIADPRCLPTYNRGSYPVDAASPAPIRSFWSRLVARVDEPIPIGA